MHAVWRLFIGSTMLAVLAAMELPMSAQQPVAPELTRQQRAALQTLIRAVDTNSATVPVDDRDWPLHVLRASDGSHYVAFSLNRAEGLSADKPAIVYVRLETRRNSVDLIKERSAVAEWLAGQSPVPVLPQRGIAFGEMPAYGAGSIAVRGPSTLAQNLQILELERERAREKREQQERARKAALEGAENARTVRPFLPFEDFDVQTRAVTDASGTPMLRRSLTSGPGEYELTVAWTDSSGDPKAPSRVARRQLSLPPASSSGLALSSVIVADDVSIRETPIPPTEQASHPYSIGGTEIAPARDHVLTPDERLALVVQIINARGSPIGKPDVEVGFRVFRRDGAREENIGALNSQTYNQLTLPLDFDVNKGHPIFAAVSVPLRTFKRGEYRMAIAANDRVAGVGVATDVTFTVVATPAALLKEAPPLAPAFDPKQERLPAAVPIMLGAIRATEGNDREAISAWHTALEGGADSLVLWPVIIDAHLRLGEAARAATVATAALATAPGHARLTRQLIRSYLLAGRHDEALRVAETHLQREGGDLEAQWLALQSLFSGFVANTGAGATPEGRARIVGLAERYGSAGGSHAALARDWAQIAR
jgi:hypothetical protein